MVVQVRVRAVLLVKDGLPTNDLAWRRLDQTHHAQAGHGFSRTGLSYDTQGSPLVYGKRHIVHGPHHVVIGTELGNQVSDFKQGLHINLFSTVGSLKRP